MLIAKHEEYCEPTIKIDNVYIQVLDYYHAIKNTKDNVGQN